MIGPRGLMQGRQGVSRSFFDGVDAIVERHPRYLVVRKIGVAREVVREEDPRAETAD